MKVAETGTRECEDEWMSKWGTIKRSIQAARTASERGRLPGLMLVEGATQAPVN
jgi:hypothetical protein